MIGTPVVDGMNDDTERKSRVSLYTVLMKKEIVFFNLKIPNIP